MSVFAGPNIAETGLVLYLDSRNSRSYPGTGTTWTDLSGRNNNGTMTSVTYSAGDMSFNGTSSKVDCGNATNLQITVGSIGAWFKADTSNSGYNGIIAKQLAWGLFVRDNLLVAYDWGNGAERSTGVTVGNNTWNHVVMTFTETSGTPSNNALIYLNGSLSLTTTVKDSGQSASVQVGEANASQFFGGLITSAFVYNRVLTFNEVQQNFQAFRGRFSV